MKTPEEYIEKTKILITCDGVGKEKKLQILTELLEDYKNACLTIELAREIRKI